MLLLWASFLTSAEGVVWGIIFQCFSDLEQTSFFTGGMIVYLMSLDVTFQSSTEATCFSLKFFRQPFINIYIQHRAVKSTGSGDDGGLSLHSATPQSEWSWAITSHVCVSFPSYVK